jgi:hypothetical protein
VTETVFEITRIAKSGGPLTKRISIDKHRSARANAGAGRPRQGRLALGSGEAMTGRGSGEHAATVAAAGAWCRSRPTDGPGAP